MFSGYMAGARFAVLLAYVLAASVPAAIAAVPEQVLGWLIGGAIATTARLLLWPLYEQDSLRQAASAAFSSLARLVATPARYPDLAERQEAARLATAEFGRLYRATPHRRAGPTLGDRALARLVSELKEALAFAGPAAGSDPHLPEEAALTAAVGSLLEQSAAGMSAAVVPDLRSVEQARLAHRAALDAWAGGRLRAGASAQSVLAGLDHQQRLRLLSYHCLAIGALATIVAGRALERGSLPILYGTPTATGFRAALRRISGTFAAHFSWTSPVMHTSLRVAIGLASGVLLARLLGLQHAFWVVLGTLSVLRSNALGTGRTAVQALAGTLLGFAVGGLFALLFARDSIVLWAALPVAVFVAAYAPSALSFVAGQATFTILLLVVFNLLAPSGWQVGLVRIEDVAVGTAIGLAAGLLLWPRGARRDFAQNLSRLYRRIAVHLFEALSLALGKGRGEAVKSAREQVWQARERTAESFDLLRRDSSSRDLSPEVGAALLSAADLARSIADSLQVAFDLGYFAGDQTEGADRLEAAGATVVASWFMLSERLEGTPVRTVPLRERELRLTALENLKAWGGEASELGKTAIAVAWIRESVEQLDKVVHSLEEPAALVASSIAAPWWR